LAKGFGASILVPSDRTAKDDETKINAYYVIFTLHLLGLGFLAFHHANNAHIKSVSVLGDMWQKEFSLSLLQ
jgi:hypothetical protein